jgi:hypothetical protein
MTVGARTQYQVKVSPDDLQFLLQWRWTYAISHRHGGLVYARRSVRSGDGNVTVLMHRVVLIECMGLERPSERHFTDHINGDGLDNRRENLRWLTAVENMKNRRGIRSTPVEAAAEVPF